MSGHSKWNNIKNKKAKTDAQKGKIFTKIGKEIAIAVRDGGADPNGNSKLRDLIAKAKAANVPNDNIDRAIKKASSADAVDYEEITYEGYGPSGVAVIVTAATDNRNRTAGDVRHTFDKYGGNMGTSGCVSFMFTDKGIIVIEKEDADIDEDALMEASLEAGAEDFAADGDVYEIYTEPSDLGAVREALEAAGYTVASAELDKIPQSYVTLDNPDDIKNMNLLIEHLEDNDDVQDIFHNWDPSLYDQYLQKFNLPNKKEFGKFSKGMKMKLGIAVALSHHPKLLILDEATSGLDPVMRDEILDIFNDFTRDESHAILISSHIVSDLEKICDYVAFLHKGNLVLFEEKDRLLEKYGIIQCTKEQLQELDQSAVIGVKYSSYNVEAVVLRDQIPKGFKVHPISIEDLFIFMIKGVH